MMTQPYEILARTTHLAPKVGCHKHMHHQIIIGVSGEADFEIEGVGGKVDEYSGCIVPSNEKHSFCGASENNVFLLDVAPELIQAQASDSHLQRLFDCRQYFSIDQQMHLLLLSLANEINTYHEDELLRPKVASLVLHSLAKRLTITDKALKSHGDRLDMNILRQYVHANIDKKIQVSDLASVCGLSCSHFYQRFREKNHCSPHQYLINERIKVARFLLKKTNRNLTDICFSLGFSSQSAFTNSFSKKMGMSPSRFRQKHCSS